MKRFVALLVFAGVPFAQQPGQPPPIPVSEPSFTGGPALDAIIH